MEIHPIAITQCDWRIYNQAAEKAKGKRATYATDQKNLDVKSLSTFFYTLDKDCVLTKFALRHGMASFLISEIYHSTIVEIIQGWDCVFQMGEMEDAGFYWMMISAKLSDWIDFTIRGSSNDVTKSTRKVANELYDMMLQCGFKDLYQNYQVYQLPDRTFELCQRNK